MRQHPDRQTCLGPFRRARGEGQLSVPILFCVRSHTNPEDTRIALEAFPIPDGSERLCDRDGYDLHHNREKFCDGYRRTRPIPEWQTAYSFCSDEPEDSRHNAIVRENVRSSEHDLSGGLRQPIRQSHRPRTANACQILDAAVLPLPRRHLQRPDQEFGQHPTGEPTHFR